MKTYPITQEVVLAFIAGAVTDPQLRHAIEEARLRDPEVQYWFDLYDPDGEEEDMLDPDAEVPETFRSQAAEVLGQIGDSPVPPPPETGKVLVLGDQYFHDQYFSEHSLTWGEILAEGGGRPPALDHS